MATEPLLSNVDQEILQRISWEWCSENTTAADIAFALTRRTGEVMRRISKMERIGLIHRRYATGNPLTMEIRRLPR